MMTPDKRGARKEIAATLIPFVILAGSKQSTNFATMLSPGFPPRLGDPQPFR